MLYSTDAGRGGQRDRGGRILAVLLSHCSRGTGSEDGAWQKKEEGREHVFEDRRS